MDFFFFSFAVVTISVTYFGAKRASRHFRLDNMPMWEQDEFAREVEYMKKMKDLDKLQE